MPSPDTWTNHPKGGDGYGQLEADHRKHALGMRKLPDGEIFYLSGIGRQVRPPERLVYTWRWEAQPEPRETLVTVEFRRNQCPLASSPSMLPRFRARLQVS